MRVRKIDHGRGALTTVRRATPDPVVRGHATRVELTVRPVRATSSWATQLRHTRITETVAHELAVRPPRGSQRAADGAIVLTYTLHTTVRGRWLIGPATATLGDPFGLVRTSRSFGSTTSVTVWPATVPLPVRASRSLAVVSDVASGARTASADDAVLREYVPGDDPRRVHWASAARQGQLMVRSDEGAGLPPATVLFDRGLLPPRGQGRVGAGRSRGRGEWSVECCASIASSLVRAGHAGRVIATSVDGVVAVPHVPGGRGESAAAVLEQCVELSGLHDAAQAEDAAVTTAEAIRVQQHPDEMTFAVLGPARARARQALSGLGEDGYRGAVIVVSRGSGTSERNDARETLAALHASGWRAVVIDEGTPIQDVWLRLTEEPS
jgi:uncharacterized protein (DUF58 family)